MAQQKVALLRHEAAIRRAKQAAFHHTGASADVVQVGHIVGLPAAEVVKSVIPNSVAFI